MTEPKTIADIIHRLGRLQYYAQGHALLGEPVPAELEEEYAALKKKAEECAAEEEAYSKHCQATKLESIIDDWFCFGSTKSTEDILQTLASGWEQGNRSNELHLNPRNLFFSEILVAFAGDVTTQDFAAAKLISGNFIMRHAVERSWIEEKFGHLELNLALDSQELQVYSVSTKRGPGALRMDLAFCPNASGKPFLRYSVVYSV